VRAGERHANIEKGKNRAKKRIFFSKMYRNEADIIFDTCAVLQMLRTTQMRSSTTDAAIETGCAPISFTESPMILGAGHKV